MSKKQKYPLLTAAEEKRLIHKIRAGDAKALDWFINCNVRMVHKIANRYRQSGLEYDDLIQEGMLGLLSAIDKFEPEQGNKFSTMAYWWIRAAITGAIREKARAIRIPSNIHEEINWFRNQYALLAAENGREPNLGELEKFTELSTDKVQLLLRYMNKSLLSIDETIKYNNDDLSSNDTTYSALLADEHLIDVAELASAREVRQKIDHVLGCLPDREADILRHRFGLIDGQPKKLREISVKLRISAERVRQLEAFALEKLRVEHLDILEDYRQVDLSVLNSEQGARQMPGISKSQIEIEAKKLGLVSSRMALKELGIAHSNPSIYFKQLYTVGLEIAHKYGPAYLYRMEDVRAAVSKLNNGLNTNGSSSHAVSEKSIGKESFSGNLANISPSTSPSSGEDEGGQCQALSNDSPPSTWSGEGSLIDKVVEQADNVGKEHVYQVVPRKRLTVVQDSVGDAVTSSNEVMPERPGYNSFLIQTAIYLSGSQTFRELEDVELQEKIISEIASIEFRASL